MVDWRIVSSALALFLVASLGSPAEELIGYAIVQDDASLRIKGHTVHLFGIYIPILPLTDPACFTFFRPSVCKPRAALALEVKITGFVRCQTMSLNEDGSRNAVCRVNYSPFDEGEDLAAYLLRLGSGPPRGSLRIPPIRAGSAPPQPGDMGLAGGAHSPSRQPLTCALVIAERLNLSSPFKDASA